MFDDTGTFPAGRWLTDFCTGYRERGLDKVLMMGCNMRADALSQAEYEMLSASNFRFILYGIESANQRTLDLLNKGTTVRQQWESVKWASEAGLEPHVTCMVGYPWETFDEAKRTIDFTRETFERGWINTLQGTIVMPYPGTQLYAQARENDWLRFDGPEHWERFDMREPVLRSPIPTPEIMGLVQSLYTSFLTPRYVARKLLHAGQEPRSLPVLRGPGIALHRGAHARLPEGAAGRRWRLAPVRLTPALPSFPPGSITGGRLNRANRRKPARAVGTRGRAGHCRRLAVRSRPHRARVHTHGPALSKPTSWDTPGRHERS